MSKVLLIEDSLAPDAYATRIAKYWITWDNMRVNWLLEKKEIQKYVFATDTTKTTNSKLPWSNKTTIPKLCQIRDNLNANYMAALFPKKKWLEWQPDDDYSNDKDKKKAIEDYMAWAIDRNEFYDEVQKLILDYIDYGNCFATVEWRDSSALPDNPNAPYEQVGYVGPALRRVSPLDIVFNPTAPDFVSSPKIVRSIVTLGEVKQLIEQMSADTGEKEDAQELFDYMVELRRRTAEMPVSAESKDEIYQISGFDNFRNYLGSSFVEVLTFYGDLYDYDKKEFQRNQVIKVVDRHRILSQRTNPSFFGTAPIYHAGWRIRPDNLWAMGPLDNLVGMQYRIDHLENMKADCFDLIAYPPIHIKGYVEDFEWGPMERIYTGDDGEVALMSPDVAALQADNQIAILEAKMEEMAGSPREAMGFRTPGEKTMYEVQRLELAAGRIFQNKTSQFERQGLECWLNAMLELSRRNMNSATIRVFDDEFQINTFQTLTVQDITGIGRIRPIAARHFAEKATMVQNLNNFFASPAYQAVSAHFSTVALSRLWECLLELEDYEIVQPYITLTEKAEAQRYLQANQEQTLVEANTPTGFRPGDSDQSAAADMGGAPQGAPAGAVSQGAPGGSYAA